MKELQWLIAVGVAMLVAAALLVIGWCLGRQGINKRIVVSAPAVHVAPAQVTVAPPQVQVEPTTINVSVPAPTVHIKESVPVRAEPESSRGRSVDLSNPKVEPKESKVEPVKAEPVKVKPMESVPLVKKDIDEFGELLPPPRK